MISDDKNAWNKASVILLGFIFLVMALTFLDYGLTWDEQNSRIQGSLYLKWFLSGFSEKAIVDESSYIHVYGQFFNLIGYVFGAVSPSRFYEISHFFIMLSGFLCLIAANLIGTHIGGGAVGFVSVVFLALTPLFYGHSFNNPKDIPFAAFTFFALYYILRLYGTLPNPPKRLLLTLGVWIGLALSVRIGAAFLFGYFFLAWGVYFISNGFFGAGKISKNIRAMLSSFIRVLVPAWVIMLVFFPYGLISPIINPIKALRDVSRFQYWELTTLFDGAFIRAKELPWYYVPRWLSVILPEFYFIAILCGMLLVLKWFFGKKKTAPSFQAPCLALVLTAVLFPFVSMILLRSVIFDGIRHIMFIVPPLSVLAAFCFVRFVASDLFWPIRLTIAISGGISMLLTAKDMIELHPYQSVFFNRSVAGGLKGADGKFETDYWGSSYKEGAEWIIKNIPKNPQGPILVANCSVPFLSEYYFRKYDSEEKIFKTADFNDAKGALILATTRWNCHKNINGRLLHVVKRQDTPLLYIFDKTKQ